jgi:hypothetical protein
MRWRKPKDGDVRVITIFSLLPTTIGNETRWLERSKVKQRYLKHSINSLPHGWWLDVEWVD